MSTGSTKLTSISRAARRSALIAFCTLNGCSTVHVGPVRQEDLLKELGFAQVGKVSREEIVAQLGAPNETYEDSRIMTYLLFKCGEQKLGLSGGAACASYNLVLVFSPSGMLSDRSLVLTSRGTK